MPNQQKQQRAKHTSKFKACQYATRFDSTFRVESRVHPLVPTMGFGDVVGQLLCFLVHAHEVAMGDAEQPAHHLVDDAGVAV